MAAYTRSQSFMNAHVKANNPTVSATYSTSLTQFIAVSNESL